MKTKTKLILTPVLVLLAISLINLFPDPKFSKVSKQLYWINKIHSQTLSNIVVGGDSRVTRGISPKKLTESLKHPVTCQNLGFHSAGYNKEYLNFLTSKLDTISLSKTVLVLGITPHSLSKEAKRNIQFKQYEQYDNYERLKLQKFEKLYSFITPYRIKEIIRPIFNIKATEEVLTTYYNDGWEEVFNSKIDTTSSLNAYKKIFNKNTIKDDDINDFITNLKSIRNRNSNINIILFRPPSSYSMEKIENKYSKFNEASLKKQLEEIGINYYRFDNSKFESGDGSHLQPESAITLSNLIGQIVKNDYNF